jgi:hypothetical protein
MSSQKEKRWKRFCGNDGGITVSLEQYQQRLDCQPARARVVHCSGVLRHSVRVRHKQSLPVNERLAFHHTEFIDGHAAGRR